MLATLVLPPGEFGYIHPIWAISKYTCLRGLAISGHGAVKAWLAIRQGVGSYPTPAGMSSQVSAWDNSRARYKPVSSLNCDRPSHLDRERLGVVRAAGADNRWQEPVDL